MNRRLRIDAVDHICVIVSDIQKVVEKISQTFETPSIKIEEMESVAKSKEGKIIGKYKIKIAIIKIVNNFTLELLQVTEGKSIEQDWLKRHGKTIHHIAIKVKDIDEEAAKGEEKGINILQIDEGKWIYLNTEDVFGMNVELVPSS